jgi:hypothetical protein
MDGLVSTGNKFPYTILKIIFSNKKIFDHFFINILFRVVDNDERFLDEILTFLLLIFLNFFFQQISKLFYVFSKPYEY